MKPKIKNMKKTQIFNSNNKSLDLVNLKKLSSLPVELHSILIGIMLGDGGIYRSSPTANARFEMSLGTKYQKFAEYLGELFKEYMSNPVKSINIKGKTNNYTNYRFKTVSLPVFNQYHDMFYIFNTDKKNYVKIVPFNINELINPIVLAYLIMTDGNFDASRNRVRIYTNSYKKDEVVKLADAIMNNLKIYTGVLHDRNDQ
jgi:LAGLIDADG DNA endonuclease family